MYNIIQKYVYIYIMKYVFFRENIVLITIYFVQYKHSIKLFTSFMTNTINIIINFCLRVSDV